MSAPKPAPGAPGPEKKGEVAELRNLLRTVNGDKDTKRKRDVLKKVIAYMTLGIDVSRLFPDMVLATNTKDLVIKKMVYLYLCTYAQSNPEMSLLVINTLQKDCRDEDPMIRGLALRALTSLRLRSILEYVIQPLKSGLNDTSGYVRQAAVVGVLKVFHISPDLVRESEFVDQLYSMIRDREAQVVANVLLTLNEVLLEEGGIAVSQQMVHHLLNRIKDFSDWGQCTVIDLLTRKYTPVNEEELFGIMNLLDVCLKVANSAVVLGTTACFIKMTQGMPEVQRQVFLRLKTPLLTLLASSSPEIAYAVLSHVALMVERAAGVFDDDFKAFFCKYTEGGAVKALKMGVLPKVACPANAREIVAELTEYVTGVDAELSRQAVRSIGEIAIRVPVPGVVDGVCEALLECVEAEAEYVRAETVIVMQELLRVHPDRAAAVIPSLHRCLKRMEDPSGKAAVIWMIGEYGQLIDDAPYLLEPLIDGVRGEESVTVKCELLTATMKLFFKRPPEVQKMLGRLFKACLDEDAGAGGGGAGGEGSSSSSSALVHDRALLYFRLLRANVREAALVVGSGDRPPLGGFYDEASSEERDKIWGEFNTLAVLYGKPSSSFISEDHLAAVIPLDAAPRAAVAADDDRLLSGDDDGPMLGGDGSAAMPSAPAPAPAPAPAQALAAAAAVDPFGDDLLGLGGFGAPAPAPIAAAPPALVAAPSLDPGAFQAKWGALGSCGTVSMRAARAPATAEVEALARAASVATVASGDTGAALKFYLYAQDSGTGAFALFEVALDKSNGVISGTVKSENPGRAGAAVAALQGALRGIPAQ